MKRFHAILVASALLATAGPALAQVYPRLGLYGVVHGENYPLTVGSFDGPLNDAVIDSVARYHQLVIDPALITPYRPDILAAIRQRRSDIQLLAYVIAENIWFAARTDSTVHYPTRMRRLVRDNNGFLYNQAGGEFSGANINLAKKDAQGHYVIAEAIADLWYDALVSSGMWDGFMIDQICNGITWMETASEKIDYVRAGYPSLAAFDASWKIGTDTLTARLRRLAGPDFILTGNCAVGTKYADCNGWVRENFPYQNGGTWYDAMFRDPGGYMLDEQRFRAPANNYLFTPASPPSAPYSSNNNRKVRFGLGSAALGTGYSAFAPSDLDGRTYPYYDWWYDEYAVDLMTGLASGSMANTGWLGQAIGPAYQMIWAGNGPDAVTNPSFETDVTTGWTFGVYGATADASRSTTTAVVGSASADLHVTTPGSVAWSVVFNTTGSLAMTQGQNYSATFWAKASTPRTVSVAAAKAGGGSVDARGVDLTTSWKQYQVVLVPSASATAMLQFQIGTTAGDIWLDDVHLQAGVNGVWRRDFQNGTVLVNPAGSTQVVPLGRNFTKIRGTSDPLVNDGSTVTQVSVGPSDALFLIGQDFTAPAAIRDLHPEP